MGGQRPWCQDWGNGVSLSQRPEKGGEGFTYKLVIDEFVILPTTSVMDELEGTCELTQSSTRRGMQEKQRGAGFQ